MTASLSERSSGLYRILRNPRAYSGLQRALSRGDRTLATFVDRHVHPDAATTIIDFGAGTGTIREALPQSVNYVAIEPNPAYCDAMRASFTDGTAEVICGGAEQLERLQEVAHIVLILAVLHHVSDDEANRILAAAHNALRAGGRLITIDPCFHDGQGLISRSLARADRGPFVRSAPGYASLAEQWFPDVRCYVETDNLRVPYSHCVLECSK